MIPGMVGGKARKKAAFLFLTGIVFRPKQPCQVETEKLGNKRPFAIHLCPILSLFKSIHALDKCGGRWNRRLDT